MPSETIERLTRTATEHGPSAFWVEALPWIVNMCGATGGQVLVDLSAPARRACGSIDELCRGAIQRWEADLLKLQDWMPLGGASLSRDPPVAAAMASADLPVAHIPIYAGHAVVGGLSLVFDTATLPGPGVIDLASALTQSLANVATLAAERHQLQRRLTQGNLLYEVSRAISSSLEVDDVLRFTTALAANALGAEASALVLIDHRTSELVFAIVHGAMREALQGRRAALADSVIARVARTGQPLIANDVRQEAVFGVAAGDLRHFAVRNVLCAPLHAKGETLGLLQVLNREGAGGFNTEDLEWLTALASQASVAIENARLYTTLREERDRIIQTEEEVRRKLARNLHDSAAQLMGSLLMNIEVARKLAQTQPDALGPEFDVLRELAQQANHELRQALLELRPPLLESRGLIGALQSYTNLQRRRGHLIVMTMQGTLPEVHNHQAEAAVYLIAQEALTNVRKHANAQHTWLRVRIQPPLLALEIEDDGDGMAAAKHSPPNSELGRMGMLTMRERTEWLGGRISFKSPCTSDGRGTQVRIEVPLARLTSPPGSDTASWIIAARSG